MTATRAGWEEIGGALENSERKKPSLPPGLIEEERTVKASGAELACSLLLPAERKPRLPAVVFITGSGPEDRDEDTVGPGGLKLAIFKVIAIELGRAGIASLRCDDRGTAKSTGSFRSATLETFVADTSAEVAALRAEAAIDPARVGLIGHSEGAIIAPVVAKADPKIAALVAEMVRSPEVMRRRLREGIEFFRFLRERRQPAVYS